MGCTQSADGGGGGEVSTRQTPPPSSRHRKPSTHTSVVKDPTRRLTDYFIVGKQIGKGHYGLVYRGEQKGTGREVAIKRINRASCTAFRIKEEIEILNRVRSHPYVVELIDAFEEDQHVSLVMELMEGGELYGRISKKGPYKEKLAAVLCRRITEALKYLHKNNIVHRDLKPENLLLAKDESIVKLADFGLAKALVNQTHMSTVCGTWAYSAPEVRIFKKMYTSKVDIWSLGVIIYTMLGGYHPFDPYGVCSESELQDNVKKNAFDFDDEVWDVVSDEAKDLIVSMLQHDPKRRPTARRILQHPWIQKFGGSDDGGSSSSDIKGKGKGKDKSRKRSSGQPSRSGRSSHKSTPSSTPASTARRTHDSSSRQPSLEDDNDSHMDTPRGRLDTDGLDDDSGEDDSVGELRDGPRGSVDSVSALRHRHEVRMRSSAGTRGSRSSIGRRSLRPSIKPDENYETVGMSPRAPKQPTSGGDPTNVDTSRILHHFKSSLAMHESSACEEPNPTPKANGGGDDVRRAERTDGTSGGGAAATAATAAAADTGLQAVTRPRVSTSSKKSSSSPTKRDESPTRRKSRASSRRSPSPTPDPDPQPVADTRDRRRRRDSLPDIARPPPLRTASSSGSDDPVARRFAEEDLSPALEGRGRSSSRRSATSGRQGSASPRRPSESPRRRRDRVSLAESPRHHGYEGEPRHGGAGRKSDGFQVEMYHEPGPASSPRRSTRQAGSRMSHHGGGGGGGGRSPRHMSVASSSSRAHMGRSSSRVGSRAGSRANLRTGGSEWRSHSRADMGRSSSRVQVDAGVIRASNSRARMSRASYHDEYVDEEDAALDREWEDAVTPKKRVSAVTKAKNIASAGFVDKYFTPEKLREMPELKNFVTRARSATGYTAGVPPPDPEPVGVSRSNSRSSRAQLPRRSRDHDGMRGGGGYRGGHGGGGGGYGGGGDYGGGGYGMRASGGNPYGYRNSGPYGPGPGPMPPHHGGGGGGGGGYGGPYARGGYGASPSPRHRAGGPPPPRYARAAPTGPGGAYGRAHPPPFQQSGSFNMRSSAGLRSPYGAPSGGDYHGRPAPVRHGATPSGGAWWQGRGGGGGHMPRAGGWSASSRNF